MSKENDSRLPSAPFFLRPWQLVYEKLSALLCVSFLVLISVHAVWQHTLSTLNGYIEILVHNLIKYTIFCLLYSVLIFENNI